MKRQSGRWPPYVDRLTRLKLALDQYTVGKHKEITFKDPRVDSVTALFRDIVTIMGREVYTDELLNKAKLIAEVDGGQWQTKKISEHVKVMAFEKRKGGHHHGQTKKSR